MTESMLTQLLKGTGVSFGINAVKMLCAEYSTLKRKSLDRREIVQMFIDRRRKYIDEIIDQRNNKYSYAKNHTPSYKIA